MHPFLAPLLLLTADPLSDNPFTDLIPPTVQRPHKVETPGPGPHTLIISFDQQIAKMRYKTGAQCKAALDEVLRQRAPIYSNGVTIAPIGTALCVPE